MDGTIVFVFWQSSLHEIGVKFNACEIDNPSILPFLDILCETKVRSESIEELWIGIIDK